MLDPTPSPMRGSGKLLTIREAARRLTLSERSLRGLIANGLIPVVRPTLGRVCIRPEDLATFIDKKGGAA